MYDDKAANKRKNI